MIHGLYDIRLTDSAGNSAIEQNILIGTQVYKDDFEECNYTMQHTQVNSCNNSILNVTSTDVDPRIYMNNITSFNPEQCRYIEVKYKTTDNNMLELFMIENPTDDTYAIRTQSLIQDGEWHTIVIDLWSNENVKNRDEITGWCFDWGANVAGVSMEIDYIRVVK